MTVQLSDILGTTTFNDGTDNVEITNVFNSVSFVRDLLDRNDILFNIEDQVRTPEVFSEILYNTPDLAWLIWKVNGVQYPFEDFILDQADINSLIEMRYRGTALYLDTLVDPFEVGSTVDLMLDSATVGTAAVLDYYPTYRKLVVETDYKGGYNAVDTIDITSKVDNRYSIHHFEDINGIYVNPYENDVFEDYLTGSLSSAIVPMTNYDYEFEKNNDNIKLSVIKVEFISYIRSNLETIREENAG